MLRPVCPARPTHDPSTLRFHSAIFYNLQPRLAAQTSSLLFKFVKWTERWSTALAIYIHTHPIEKKGIVDTRPAPHAHTLVLADRKRDDHLMP